MLICSTYSAPLGIDTVNIIQTFCGQMRFKYFTYMAEVSHLHLSKALWISLLREYTWYFFNCYISLLHVFVWYLLWSSYGYSSLVRTSVVHVDPHKSFCHIVKCCSDICIFSTFSSTRRLTGPDVYLVFHSTRNYFFKTYSYHVYSFINIGVFILCWSPSTKKWITRSG